MTQKKLLIFALLTAFLFVAVATSVANAEEDLAPPLLGNNAADSSDTPNLIATQNDTLVTTEQPPTALDQTRENSTSTSDDTAMHTMEENGGIPPQDAPNLIATQTAPDNTPLIVGIALVSLVAVCVVIVAVVTSRRRKALA